MPNTLKDGANIKTGPAGTIKNDAENAAEAARKEEAKDKAEGALMTAPENGVLYRVMIGFPVFNTNVPVHGMEQRVEFVGGFYATDIPEIIDGLDFFVKRGDISLIEDNR